MAELSPMMKQYFEIKKDYGDTILMFRLGDFYEMFFDDAKTASKELDLVLTGRDCGQEERAPMCGVPFHSADSHLLPTELTNSDTYSPKSYDTRFPVLQYIPICHHPGCQVRLSILSTFDKLSAARARMTFSQAD